MDTRPPSLGLVADRRIREAAARGGPGLDVRGPISEAMARTGLAVPARAPAPTPAAPLSGLTADERRVHAILIDALAMTARQGLGDGTGISTLSFAEKKNLAVLDLPFIEAELIKMTSGGLVSPTVRWTLGVGTALGAGLLAAMVFTGEDLLTGGALVSVLTLVLALGALALQAARARAGSPQREKVYRPLRELALVAHDDLPVSDALQNADRVIDRLALSDQTPASTPALRGRVRS